jgi:hypothetical protein
MSIKKTLTQTTLALAATACLIAPLTRATAAEGTSPGAGAPAAPISMPMGQEGGMMSGPGGMGMMNPQMMMQNREMMMKHMTAMETHMANIEALLRELVALQKAK